MDCTRGLGCKSCSGWFLSATVLRHHGDAVAGIEGGPRAAGLVEVGDEHDVAVMFVRAGIERPLPVGGNGKTFRTVLQAQIGDPEIS